MTYVSDEAMVERFVVSMTERLRFNAKQRGKSGWQWMSPKRLLRRAEQELGELRHAIETKSHPAVVAREAADVGNFCAMLTSVYENLGVGEDRPAL